MKDSIVLAVALSLATGSAAATNLYVNPSGANGAHKTVQAAVNAAPAGTASNRTIIYIAPGTYKEKINVPSSKSFLCFIGQTTDATKVVLTYNLNATSANGSGGTVGTTGSSSTTISATDFIAKNVTFQNSTHDNIAQAVALKTAADRMAFSNCRFFGFQDTLYVTGGRQYFTGCYITGDTDFIFGNATALFNSCYINESSTWGFITAPNTEPTTAIGLVFKYCALTKNPVTAIDPETGTRYSTITSVSNNATYLGRPWQFATEKSGAAFIQCKMDTHIIAAGWHPWDANANPNPAATTRFAEYYSSNINGTVKLDLTARVKWATKLSSSEAARYSVANIFGPASYWGSGYVNWGTFVAWNPITALNSVPNQ